MSVRSIERLKSDGTIPVAAMDGRKPMFDGPTCLAIIKARKQEEAKRRSQHYVDDEVAEPIIRETCDLLASAQDRRSTYQARQVQPLSGRRYSPARSPPSVVANTA